MLAKKFFSRQTFLCILRLILECLEVIINLMEYLLRRTHIIMTETVIN